MSDWHIMSLDFDILGGKGDIIYATYECQVSRLWKALGEKWVMQALFLRWLFAWYSSNLGMRRYDGVIELVYSFI